MAYSINRVELMGHVGKDPEILTTTTGVKYAKFSLATNESEYTKKDGTKVPEVTVWHDIKVWRDLAGIVERFVHKGSNIYVTGKITSRDYEKDGVKRRIFEIEADEIGLLDSKPQGQQPYQGQYQQQYQPQQMQPQQPFQGYQQQQNGYQQQPTYQQNGYQPNPFGSNANGDASF